MISVGTSGWNYAHWNGPFYPDGIRGLFQLPYYTTFFKTVEINATFYHDAKIESVQRWAESTPPDFRFSIKLHRYMTHMKKLIIDEQSDRRLRGSLSTLTPLGDKLHVILIQCPPGLTRDLTRLTKFLLHIKGVLADMDMKPRLAIEFRHQSWFREDVFDTLRTLNVANVVSDGADKWPLSYEVTSNFGYIRLHGHEKLYASLYSGTELKHWKAYIDTMMKDVKDVYVYFDNDGSANAIKNAIFFDKLS